jgi:hypothetical protein
MSVHGKDEMFDCGLIYLWMHKVTRLVFIFLCNGKICTDILCIISICLITKYCQSTNSVSLFSIYTFVFIYEVFFVTD